MLGLFESDFGAHCLTYSGSFGTSCIDISRSGSTYSTSGSDAIARMNARASRALSLRAVVTTSATVPKRREWRAFDGNALASRSSFDWTAAGERASAAPLRYRIMKRSWVVCGSRFCVFIFNADRNGTVVDDAALAASATSRGVDVCAAACQLIALAKTAIGSKRQPATAMRRPVTLSDKAPLHLVSRLFLCIVLGPFFMSH